MTIVFMTLWRLIVDWKSNGRKAWMVDSTCNRSTYYLNPHYQWKLQRFPFFISEADYPGLERIIFKLGFFINGLVLIYVSWLLFKACKPRARWYMMHVSCVVGILVGINLSLMSIWDVYDYERLHVFTASNVFQLGLVWGVAPIWGYPMLKSKQEIKVHLNQFIHLSLRWHGLFY